MSDNTHNNDLDPVLADLIVDAFETTVDVDVASRHLWSISEEVAKHKITMLMDKAEFGEDLDDDNNIFVNDNDGTDDYLSLDEEPSVKSPKFFSTRRLIALAGAPALSVLLVGSISSAGIAMASQSSRPGDLLYPVKRGTEQARLAMTVNEEERAALQLSFANERLKEIRDVGAVKPDMVPELVTDLDASLSQTADITGGQRIRQAAINEVSSLEEVAPLPKVSRRVAKSDNGVSKKKTVVVETISVVELLNSPTASPSIQGNTTNSEIIVDGGKGSEVAKNTEGTKTPSVIITEIPDNFPVVKQTAASKDLLGASDESKIENNSNKGTKSAKPSKDMKEDAVSNKETVGAELIAKNGSPEGSVAAKTINKPATELTLSEKPASDKKQVSDKQTSKPALSAKPSDKPSKSATPSKKPTVAPIKGQPTPKPSQGSSPVPKPSRPEANVEVVEDPDNSSESSDNKTGNDVSSEVQQPDNSDLTLLPTADTLDVEEIDIADKP